MPQAHQAVDSLDRRLIGLLLSDARRSFVSLAESLAISDAAVYKRTRRLLETGVIRCTASVNLSRVGAAMPFIILMRVAPEHIQSAIDVLAGYPRTARTARASGPYSIVATVSFGSSNEVTSFVTEFLPRILGVEAREMLPIILTRRSHKRLESVSSIDSKDRSIISELQEDSRQDAVRLARKTGIPPRTVRRRLTRLMESEIVIPSVVVKPGTIGFCEGSIGIRAEPGHLLDVWERVAVDSPGVDFSSLTIGAFDIMAHVWGESPGALEHLAEHGIKKLSGVLDCTVFVMEEVRMGLAKRLG